MLSPLLPGLGIEAHVQRFEADHDDYQSIMLKALADRLAEAFAEYLHERVRKDFWGYASDESLSNHELVKEQYKGIRPASQATLPVLNTRKNLYFGNLSIQ